MIFSEAYVKLVPLLPFGKRWKRGQEYPNGIWRWNVWRIRWPNNGVCPSCGMRQSWGIVHDDSYVPGWLKLTAAVTCRNPACGNQVWLTITYGNVEVKK